MNRRALAILVALDLALPAIAETASSQPAAAPSEAVRLEARERFDRGLRLFNEGDNSGALVEFRRAYDLVQNPVVLYNIGLVYGQMGRAVEATDALDRLLAAPGNLAPERLALARQSREEQAARIAQIGVDANVAGARIEIDGIEAGKTPTATPLRVTGGTHVVGVVATGYLPQRKEIAIAGGQTQSLRFDLDPTTGGLAQLVVKTHLPGADVYADAQRIGTTPFSASIALAPGRHRVELRRAGYVTAATEITLTEGASGEVALEPEEDRAAGGSQGSLALDVSEAQPVVTVDGRLRGVYASPLRLMAGPHHLLIERADFESSERDVTIDPDRTTAVRVVLEPTPEYRIRFAARARAQRTWGWVAVVVGPIVAGGGAGLLAYDAKQRSEGNATIARIQSENAPNTDELCSPSQQTTTAAFANNCTIPFNNATSQVDDANTRDDFAYGAIGVGAAGLIVGIVLLATSDDPHKYDRPVSPETEGAIRAWPLVWAGPSGGNLGLAGTFW